MMALVDAVGGLPPPVALAIRIKDELDTAVLETEKALLALGAVRLGGDGPTSTDPDDDEVNDPRRKCRFYAINTKNGPDHLGLWVFLCPQRWAAEAAASTAGRLHGSAAVIGVLSARKKRRAVEDGALLPPPRNPKINMPAWVFCTSWHADSEFRATSRCRFSTPWDTKSTCQPGWLV